MLTTGSKLGPYEIASPIGAGGMGEVYRARDTRLGRDVALKVLPEAFARDAERMTRLRREAQTLASLNHPNIAAIYGFEDSGSTHALVMELVEGPTLADRIKQGAIPLDEALPIAKQICEAVEYAHERGIVHRDLKPSNVKVTHDGQVKVLDFGLAKAVEGDPSTTGVENSPTLSAMATQAGFLLGTAAYMSPEQARGKKADRRADIWAFGVVLYEMLSGKRLFTGETTSDTLAAVIRAEPDWNELPAQTPWRIRELLQRCLKKDPRQRLQSIGDARIALEEAVSGGPQYESAVTGGVKPPLQRTSQKILPWATAALLAIITALLAVGYFFRASEPAPALVSQIEPPPNSVFEATAGQPGMLALSPDGQRLAFVAKDSDGRMRLWVRPLNSLTAQPLDGTDGARFPFWSPDSRSIGFFAAGKLNRIDASGASLLALADAEIGQGASWSSDGTIVFAPGLAASLFRVSASGGELQQVTNFSPIRKDFAHRWPQFLPDGKHFLFFVWSADSENTGVYVGSLDGGEPKMVLGNPSDAVFVPPNHLLFVRQETLVTEHFDPASFQLSGDVSPLVEHFPSEIGFFAGPFTFSFNGILVYAAGAPAFVSTRLLWLDRSGRQIGETGAPGFYETVSISPDGSSLATSMSDAEIHGVILVFDLRTGLSRRLNFSNSFNVAAVWSSDGKTLAFHSSRDGGNHIFQKPADGSGSTTPLFADKDLEQAAAFVTWSPDGRYLVFVRGIGPNGSRGIWARPLFGDGKPFPVVQGAASAPKVSPDGKWLAYVGNDSGRNTVYVVPFPRGSGKWQVSANGGSNPHWRSDGRGILYLSSDRQIMSAAVVEQGSTLAVGKVQPLFRPNIAAGWDVTPDGQKFLIISPVEQKGSQPLTLVTNWPALLKKQ
jgi:serine/threonine protein kinase/Tol biopolymer transport system component